MKIRLLHFMPLILVLSFAISCTSSSKYLEKGNYDKAISKSVKILMKKPDKNEELRTLKKAFSLANKRDIDRIRQLKLSGQPDIFDNLADNYSRLINRQDLVERLPNEALSRINFKHIDYTTELVESKKKAAEYFYARGNKLLETADKIDARRAYSDFKRVKQFFPAYYQIDSKIEKAEYMGTNNIIFYIQNESRTELPKNFENEILKVSIKKLNRQWLNFDTWENENINYDYSIYLSIKEIVTSPDLVKEIHYKEEKTIQDGYEYVLDDNGNVKKDTSGNDIKVPSYKVISCNIIETRMNKSARVGGSLDFYDNRDRQLIKTMPVATEFVFDYSTAFAQGDARALKKETKRKIGMKPLPFPTNLQMIFDTNEDLKAKVKNIISSNRNILLD